MTVPRWVIRIAAGAGLTTLLLGSGPLTLAQGSTLTIDTTEGNGPGPNGIGPLGEGTAPLFGFPSFATWGETFRAPGVPSQLVDFTFFLKEVGLGLTHTHFAAYVAAWDGTKAVGPILFSSPERTTSNFISFETFQFAVGGLPLAAGGEYIAFLSSSDFFDGLPDGVALSLEDTFVLDPYPDGHVVFKDNGTDFASLFATPWQTVFIPVLDVGFVAHLSVATPQPPGVSLIVIGLLASLGIRSRLARRPSGRRREF